MAIASKKKDTGFSPWASTETLKSAGGADKPDPTMRAYEAWTKDPTPENSGELVKALEPTINSALNTYAASSKDSLKVKARLLALDAASAYKPDRGTHLKTYVFNHLQRLRRVDSQRNNVVKIPENVSLERNALRKAEDAFKAEYGREPTRDELADTTGISIRRMEKIEDKYPMARSSGSLLTEKGDTLFTNKKDPYQIWADYVYHDLDARDKKIFEWSTGYGGSTKLSKGEIARRLGVSNATISKRVNKIISELERGYSLENS